MGVEEIFTRPCIKTNAESAGKFVCPGLDDLMSKDDKTSVVKPESQASLYVLVGMT